MDENEEETLTVPTFNLIRTSTDRQLLANAESTEEISVDPDQDW